MSNVIPYKSRAARERVNRMKDDCVADIKRQEKERQRQEMMNAAFVDVRARLTKELHTVYSISETEGAALTFISSVHTLVRLQRGLDKPTASDCQGEK